MILECVVVECVALGIGVASIHRSVFRAMGHGVYHPGRIGLGVDDEMTTHREEAEATGPDCHVQILRVDHLAEAHGGNASPTIGPREKAPIVKPVARRRVADVVGGQREAVDLEENLSACEPTYSGAGDESAFAKIVSVDLEIDGLVGVRHAYLLAGSQLASRRPERGSGSPSCHIASGLGLRQQGSTATPGHLPDGHFGEPENRIFTMHSIDRERVDMERSALRAQPAALFAC